jgi:5-formyltetrahydrofolate cyclo-ligase
MTAHDVPVDVVATPTRLIRTRRAFPRPAGIRWEELSAAQLAAMPPLAALGRASPRR